MATLVIETATAACSVALIAGTMVIAERHELVGRGHAERLVPQIADLFATAGVAQAEAILVDCGPGSFTGVRVGLAAARALALAWAVPVHGFSSLALIAAANESQGLDLAVALLGGHGELFVQRFVQNPLAELSDAMSLTPEAAAEAVPEALVLGAGAAALVTARGSGEAREAWPRAADARLLPAPFVTLPPTPRYGRAPDAALPA